LEDFKQTKEFVAVMHAALKGEMTIFLAASQVKLTHIIAHKAAYNINILHQDISPGNILIFGPDDVDKSSKDSNELKIASKGGLLINWDLLKVIDSENEPTAICHYICTVS
jgi:Fungal protein kinase